MHVLDEKSQIVDDLVVVDQNDFLIRNAETVSFWSQFVGYSSSKSIHVTPP